MFVLGPVTVGLCLAFFVAGLRWLRRLDEEG